MVGCTTLRRPVSGVSRAFTLISTVAVAGLVCGQAAGQEAVRRAPAPIVYAGASAATTPIDLRPGALAPLLEAATGPAVPAKPAAGVSRAESSTTSFALPHAGPPYQVEGRWYVPMHEPDYDETGVASWYGPNFHGKLASTGEVYDQYAMTAAHPTLPIPSIVRVTNLENGRSITVRLNDRGPFINDRIIDLSRAAAEAIDMTRAGTAKVRVEYVGPVGVEEQPDAFLAKYVPPAGEATVVSQIGSAPLPPMDIAPKWPGEAAPAARAEAGPEFVLQAGSFADLANAHKLKASLSAFGPVSVQSAVVGGSEYYRVVLGPWSSRADAVAARDRLAAAGSKTIVVEQDR